MPAELAVLSSHSKPVIAEQSGHFIRFNQPELVFEGVREVVEVALR